MRRRSLVLAAPVLLAAPALAQGAYPNKPLRIIIPWPPGQATDLVGRLSAQILSEELGQPVVPENKAGAGGMIGADQVAKGPADGYTLLAGSSGPISINPLFPNRAPYDPEKELAPIAMVGLSGYSLVVRTGFPASNVQEFIALLKREPDKYTFSSSGTGATTHLIVELFNHRAGVKALHVPFAGSTPALTAVVAGQVDYTIETFAATGGLIRGGQLKSFGVSIGRTSALAPGQPTLAEAANLPGFDVGAWIGVMAQANTPKPIVEALAQAMQRGLAKPGMQDKLAAIGMEPEHHFLDDFASYLRRQKQSFADTIRTANIRID